jgi:cation transport regulator ChaC
VTSATWVFGYGSLVAPASIGRTLGRPVERRVGYEAAWLEGFGRRWNYGSLHQRGDWDGPDGRVERGVIVCLGLAVSTDERCNGAVIELADDELALLDWRERDYDRVDVTDAVTVEADGFAGRIVTYLPRRSAIERYLAARDGRRAAIRRSYVDLVEGAFEELGRGHLAAYRSATPAPDVPVVEVD